MKGSITPVIPKGQTIWFEYNPAQWESAKDVEWAEINVPGLDFPLQQFVRGGLRTVSMEVYFNADGYDKPFAVKDAVAALETLLEKSEETAAPPVCLFSWGSFQVTCLVGAVSARYTMFDRDGTLTEATVTLTLRAYQESAVEFLLPQPVEPIRSRKSPVFSGIRGSGSVFAPETELNIAYSRRLVQEGMAKTHVVKQGESARSIANAYYGTPALWRVISFANQITRSLKPGSGMIVPDHRNALSILERTTAFSKQTLQQARVSMEAAKT